MRGGIVTFFSWTVAFDQCGCRSCRCLWKDLLSEDRALSCPAYATSPNYSQSEISLYWDRGLHAMQGDIGRGIIIIAPGVLDLNPNGRDAFWKWDPIVPGWHCGPTPPVNQQSTSGVGVPTSCGAVSARGGIAGIIPGVFEL